MMNLAREAAFQLGGMQIRPSTREVVHSGGCEVVEPRVMAVLVRLARAKGQVVTRDELTEACWEGRIVSDDAINRVISRIRRVSELTGGRDFTLETITKVGYRLMTAGEAPIEVEGAAGSSSSILSTARAQKLSVGIVGGLTALIVALVAGSWWAFGREPEWTPDPKASLTLAVLPFDNLGTAGEDQVLAIGMSREIRNTLSRVRGLRVVSDSSSFAIASEPLSATDMGRRLNADLLLDGSFTREGETIRLSAELVDGWSGVNLWAGSESGAADDLDRLRQEISAAVFEQLVSRLGPERLDMMASPKHSEPKTYRLLVEVRQLLASAVTARLRGQPDLALDIGERANELVDQALAMEPGSAAALVLKGRVVATSLTRELSSRGPMTPEALADAVVYFRQALVSDPDDADALRAMGEYYRRFEWRWAEARALLLRALAIDPNNVDAHLAFSYYYSQTGRCVDSLRHARAATEIDPEFTLLVVPRALKCLGRFEESDEAYRAVLMRDPENIFALREVYLNHLTRRDAAGLRDLRTFVRDDLWEGKPNGTIQGWLDWTEVAAAALDGDTAPFAEMIEASLRSPDTPPGTVAGITEVVRPRSDELWMQAIEFAAADKPQRAIDLLKASIAAGGLYIPETMPYGAFEFTPEVRADPRYQAIWKSDPRLVEIVALRLEAVKARQMLGYLPDGSKVVPASSEQAS